MAKRREIASVNNQGDQASTSSLTAEEGGCEASTIGSTPAAAPAAPPEAPPVQVVRVVRTLGGGVSSAKQLPVLEFEI